ncbi:hypothetical protein SAMN02982922_2375 [Mesorhizobium australicum]|uniref:Uncharacterized protein n=1 Tax=Mesorhizobium australicum TaxID=536018 RepID=A0A1X7NRE9_9HYPH|nr:hypothetical protein SAMN02982922_2375 [Mesorhizobium australicum]
MRFSIQLPNGKLKLRTEQHLRTLERDRKIPVFKFGRLYISWWKAGAERRHRTESQP